ncbi:MAG: thiamine phosphate synthase [Bacteroidota bacterium]
MKHRHEFSLYLVTDRKLSHPRTIEDVVRSAIKGGVSAVQLREKDCSTREYIASARRIHDILKPLNIPLIINDRIDVALAMNADGIHIGQSDMPYSDARKVMGTGAIIGLSIETMEQAFEAENLDVDYLGVSPIFSTSTKTDTAAGWGIEGLKALRAQSRHTLIAIGGINSSNAAAVMEAGADGIAVVSAICASPDPEESSGQLRSIIEQKHRMKRIVK